MNDDLTVQVHRYPNGVCFSVVLIADALPAQVNQALAFGCQSAARFDCGLAMSPRGDDLLLTRWREGACDAATIAMCEQRMLREARIWRTTMQSVLAEQPLSQVNRQDMRSRQTILNLRA